MGRPRAGENLAPLASWVWWLGAMPAFMEPKLGADRLPVVDPPLTVKIIFRTRTGGD